jgi:hypothetical protein
MLLVSDRMQRGSAVARKRPNSLSVINGVVLSGLSLWPVGFPLIRATLLIARGVSVNRVISQYTSWLWVDLVRAYMSPPFIVYYCMLECRHRGGQHTSMNLYWASTAHCPPSLVRCACLFILAVVHPLELILVCQGHVTLHPLCMDFATLEV